MLFCGCYFVSVLVVVVARVLDVVTPRMGVGVLALLVVIYTVSCNLYLCWAICII